MRRWMLLAGLLVLAAVFTWLSFVEHMAGAFIALFVTGLAGAGWLYWEYVRWVQRPGKRDLKLFLTGGPLTLMHDRSSQPPSLVVRGLLGGIDSLLVTDDDSDDD